MRAILLSLTATLAALGGGGCLVDSQCQSDYDCTEGQRCERSSGQCAYECTTNHDCWVGGAYIGKECMDRRCVFRFGERVAAPNFCMQVVNPRSASFGRDFCLADQQGKVVALYFAWLT
jgi:hypothetical protein